MKLHLTLFFSLLFFTLSAQNLFPEPGLVFDDEVIPRIDITIHPDSLAVLLDEDNIWDKHEFPADFSWDNGSTVITRSTVGFRLRGNSSRQSAKKSFKVDFSSFGGNDFEGLSEMNLNGEHNDPTIMRSKLCWDLYRQANIPVTRANHVLLYINDVYYGLYINVEHIDKDFLKKRWADASGNLYKCFYGADLDYLGSNPDSYKHTPFGNRVYDLKTNRQDDDYTDLALFIAILNDPGATDFRCKLESVFEVETYLKTIAMDILTGNWDGPIFNKNNFYLYSNPATGKIQYLPYDLDNTFGIDWFGITWSNRNIYNWAQENEPRPIYNNILSVPEYRNHLSFYFNEFLTDFFNSAELHPYLDDFRDRLSPHVVNDTFAQLDYGFTHSDFLNAFQHGLGDHVPVGIKEYLASRITTAQNQLQLQDIAPALEQENFYWAGNELIFSVRAADENLPTVSAQYNFDGQGWQSQSLKDDGQYPDQLAGDGIFSGSAAFSGVGSVEYYFTATDGNFTSRRPFCGNLQSGAGHGPVPFLFINEFMADNNYSWPDEAGEYDDWLEIYNGGSSDVYLGDKFLSDDHSNPQKWLMPDVTLPAGDFMLFWCDEDQPQGANHTNFKLSRSGEELGIWDSAANNFAPIDTFTYGAVAADTPWGLYPNGSGPIQQLSWRTPGASNVPLAIRNPEETRIKAFPNPTGSNIVVTAQNPIIEIELIDALGRTQRFRGADKPTMELDLSAEAAGIYLLKVWQKEGMNSIKVVKF